MAMSLQQNVGLKYCCQEAGSKRCWTRQEESEQDGEREENDAGVLPRGHRQRRQLGRGVKFCKKSN